MSSEWDCWSSAVSSAAQNDAYITYVAIVTPTVYHMCVGPHDAHLHFEQNWDHEELMGVKNLLMNDSVIYLQQSTRQLRILKKCLESRN